MPDLLIRNVPDELLEGYTSKALESGAALERYVLDVLQGRHPALHRPLSTTADLVALTERNLARFAQPLPALQRHEMREGMEE
jgi:hypothetical protein